MAAATPWLAMSGAVWHFLGFITNFLGFFRHILEIARHFLGFERYLLGFVKRTKAGKCRRAVRKGRTAALTVSHRIAAAVIRDAGHGHRPHKAQKLPNVIQKMLNEGQKMRKQDQKMPNEG
jgi:hypothetical protein